MGSKKNKKVLEETKSVPLEVEPTNEVVENEVVEDTESKDDKINLVETEDVSEYKYKIGDKLYKEATPEEISNSEKITRLPYDHNVSNPEVPEESLKIPYEGPYNITSIVLGKYEFPETTDKPVNITALDYNNKDAASIYSFFSYNCSYPEERLEDKTLISEDNEVVVVKEYVGNDWERNKGKLLLPKIPDKSLIPGLDKFKTAADLREENEELYAQCAKYVGSMLTVMLKFNGTQFPMFLEEGQDIVDAIFDFNGVYSMADVLANMLSSLYVSEGGKVSKDVAFIGDPEALFVNDKRITTYYYKKHIERLREISGHDSVIVISPIPVLDSLKDGYRVTGKFKITYYSKDNNFALCLLASLIKSVN